MTHFTVLTRTAGYSLNQATSSVEELTPGQSKKGLHVEHKKSTMQIKKLLKETKLFPPSPSFPFCGPKFGW